jgi:hypothetical protein
VVDLAHVDVGVEAVRVAGLVVDGRVPGAALADGAFDEGEIPVESIGIPAIDGQPAATVDPGSPLAEIGHCVRRVAVVQLSGQQPEVLDPRRTFSTVVDAEIYVGVRMGFSACPRATQGNGLHTLDLPETFGYHLREPQYLSPVSYHLKTPVKDPLERRIY